MKNWNLVTTHLREEPPRYKEKRFWRNQHKRGPRAWKVHPPAYTRYQLNAILRKFMSDDPIWLCRSVYMHYKMCRRRRA